MSDQIHVARDLTLSFIVLCFLKKKDLQKMQRDGVVHFYEYYSKAISGRAINGRPMFTSCTPINSTDYKRVREEERRMRIALGEIKDETVNNERTTVDVQREGRTSRNSPRV